MTLLLIVACETKKEEDLTAVKTFSAGKNIIDFKLVDHDGKLFDNKRLKDKWSLLFFGYTKCPDVCPTELFLLANVFNKLSQSDAPKPQVFFITLDPERDTAQSLKEYVQYFDTDFVGVSGNKAELDKLYHQFEVMYERFYNDGAEEVVVKDAVMPDKYQDSYLINHSAFIYVTNPAGKYYGIIPAPHQVDEIAEDLIKIRQQ